MKEYDIAIIGSGPAGATLARLLSKSNLKIIIIDRRDLNNQKSNLSKSCGGLIAPDAQKTLAQFGLGIPKNVLVGPQLFTVRVIDFDNNIDRFYQRHYINVDREKFDRWLVSLIPNNIDRLFSTRLSSIEYKKDIYEIKCRGDAYVLTPNENKNENDSNGDICRGDALMLAPDSGDSGDSGGNIGVGTKAYPYQLGSIKIRAKIIVGADGGNSKVRKIISRDKFKKYVSIQEWYKVENPMPYFSSIFDQSITDFYSWTIPKDDYLILGAAIHEDDNARERFNILKDKLSKYGYSFDKRLKKEGAFIVRPQYINQIFLGEKNIALIGEAAGLISPSSAEGISYALKSANFLADAILRDKNNFLALYKKNVKKLKLNIIIKNIKSPFMYNKTLRNTVMKSKILSMKIKY